MKIFEMRNERSDEEIKLSLESEEEQKLVEAFKRGDLQFIDKNPIEIKVSDEGGVEYPDILSDSLVLFSDELKSLLDKHSVNNNIFYKPVYIVDELLEERSLYWLTVVPFIEFYNGEGVYDVAAIGNYKVFRDYRKSDFITYVTEELKDILEKEKLERIIFQEI